MDTKICARCGEEKLLELFAKDGKGGRKNICKKCCAERQREYRAKDTPEQKESRKAYHKAYRKKKIDIVFEHYGNKCACCGEDNFLFLTLDHVDNDGAEHRRSVNANPRSGNTDKIYRKIIEEGFPPKFQILCYNCNCGKHRNGGILCPHSEVSSEGYWLVKGNYRLPLMEDPIVEEIIFKYMGLRRIK